MNRPNLKTLFSSSLTMGGASSISTSLLPDRSGTSAPARSLALNRTKWDKIRKSYELGRSAAMTCATSNGTLVPLSRSDWPVSGHQAREGFPVGGNFAVTDSQIKKPRTFTTRQHKNLLLPDLPAVIPNRLDPTPFH